MRPAAKLLSGAAALTGKPSDTAAFFQQVADAPR